MVINIYTKEFKQAKKIVLEADTPKRGIGRLQEKNLHAILKHTLEPCEDFHEIKVGSYFVDIKNHQGIIEIQTRNLNAIRNKLTNLLKENTVILVHPQPSDRWIVWIDNETGLVSSKRKSPKKGSVYQSFLELYKIKSLLNHPNLRLWIPLVDIEEYRNLDGWSKDGKKGSSRYNQLPLDLVDIVKVECINDYYKLLPKELITNFTTKDFKKYSATTQRMSTTALTVLKHLGIITAVGKLGRNILYSRSDRL